MYFPHLRHHDDIDDIGQAGTSEARIEYVFFQRVARFIPECSCVDCVRHCDLLGTKSALWSIGVSQKVAIGPPAHPIAPYLGRVMGNYLKIRKFRE